MDRIAIEDLVVRTVVGVHDWERDGPREVHLDLVLETDLGVAAASDSLADTVDYGTVARCVIAHAEVSRFQLLESLAGSIADLVLAEFPAVRATTVRVKKPRALPSGLVFVELRRTR